MQAKSPRVAAALLTAAALLSSVGCSSSPLEQSVDAMQGCVDAMKTITDADSASAGTEPLKTAFAEMGAAQKAFVDLMMKDPSAVLDSVGEMVKLGPEIERLQSELDQQEDRLHTIKGLPVEFWNMYRVEVVRLETGILSSDPDDSEDAALGAGFMQLEAMYGQFGPEKVVEFELTNVTNGDKDAAVQRIRALAGQAAQVVEIEDPEDYDVYYVALGPVEDFDKLMAAVNFGTIVDQDKARAGATVQLASATVETPDWQPADAGQAVAADATAPDAGIDGAASTEVPADTPADGGYGESTAADLGRPVEGPPPGYENRGGATYPPSDQVAEQTTDGSAGYESGATDPPAGYENRGDAYPREGYPPADAGAMAEQPQDPSATEGGPAPTAAEMLMQQAKSALGGFFGGAAPGDAAGLVPTGEPGVPQPNSPTYHAQLAELLFDEQSPQHRIAVETLLTIKPSAVADKKVRGRIAQGYRNIAFRSQQYAAQGVEGLVIWGGKFSAPLLIQLLNGEGGEEAGEGVDGPAEGGDAPAVSEEDRMGRPDPYAYGRGGGSSMGSGPVPEDAIFAALGKLGTPEGAKAIAERLAGATTNTEAAVAALREMGPVAEGPLMGVMPFESPEANLSAIALLGDVGTKKCVAMLRRATKSENEAIVEAALEAIRKIQQRGQPAATPG